VWDTRKEDGTVGKVPVTMSLPADVNADAPGYEGQPHLKIDDGDYGLTISEGPSFNTKTEEGTEFLLALIKADPALIPIYAPAIFKRLGYEDLEEIATAAQPPQIQQALAAARGQGPNPAMLQQQAQQLQQQNQQLKNVLQQVLMKLQTKQVENEGRLAVQNAKTQGEIALHRLEAIQELIKSVISQQHDSTTQLTDHHFKSVDKMLDMFHQSELPVQSAALAPEPQQEPVAA
jgi:crotonobetainyl-CoA:carnitine CoA-transferase CaiB-like acyl-CoA transferase